MIAFPKDPDVRRCPTCGKLQATRSLWLRWLVRVLLAVAAAAAGYVSAGCTFDMKRDGVHIEIRYPGDLTPEEQTPPAQTP